MTEVLRARLTGRAARYVTLLQDFGHLDEDAVTNLLVAVAQARGDRRELLADLPLVRRVAAGWLFEAHDLPDGAGVLPDDWALLFS